MIWILFLIAAAVVTVATVGIAGHGLRENWTDVVQGLTIGFLLVVTLLVVAFFFLGHTLRSECGFCDDASSSVSNAPR